MASRKALLLALTATWTITVRTSLADPCNQVGTPCALLDCGPEYNCVERNNIGRCILANKKPGECPMFKCAENKTLCSNHECDGDYGCPGTDKCCWECDNCFRCLSWPDPAPAPRAVCGDQVCGSEKTCVEIPIMCLIPPCSPIQRCVKTSCTLPAVSGKCRAAFRRYHYDYKTSTCNRFIYGGCGGNANNFATEADCLAACS